MIHVYPYNSPVIMTDSVFTMYGGMTGTFTQAQRSAAYLIAEQQATTYLNAFLLPTTVTGTWGYASRITTDYGYVTDIKAVNILSQNGSTNCNLQSNNGCVFVWEDTFGYLDVGCVMNYCGCNNYVVPYQIQVSYESGLPTGVATQPAVLLALTMAAQISLNEMIYPSQNEGVGDIGVQEYSSMGYSEKRKTLKFTAFGSSAKAQKIANLLSSTITPARHALLLK
mgnify:CR=1 FL=1